MCLGTEPCWFGVSEGALPGSGAAHVSEQPSQLGWCILEDLLVFFLY